MLRKFQKGQSAVEYTVLIILLMGAFLGAQNYFKRGVQGRWKEAADGLGDQYDPRFGNGSVRSTLLSQTETRIESIPLANGDMVTSRVDLGNTLETKTGFITTGAYD